MKETGRIQTTRRERESENVKESFRDIAKEKQKETDRDR